MIKVYNRKLKKYYNEEQYGSKKLEYLYNTKLGRILLKIAINKLTSNIYGIYKKSRISKKNINPFIDKYHIDMSIYEKREYKSFNDFFTRKKINPKFNKKKNILISPCDSKVLYYKITNNLTVNIKGTNYNLDELLKHKAPPEYRSGSLLVFRLSMDNYHRYCYIDNGKLIASKYIKGCLHTVSSVSKNYKIYKENKRVINILELENFGKVIQIEVGAILVGNIINNNYPEFKKGEEKGYFQIGGSTIVLITKDNIEIDKDIIENSKKGIETLVEYGEKVGKLKDD